MAKKKFKKKSNSKTGTLVESEKECVINDEEVKESALINVNVIQH